MMPEGGKRIWWCGRTAPGPGPALSLRFGLAWARGAETAWLRRSRPPPDEDPRARDFVRVASGFALHDTGGLAAPSLVADSALASAPCPALHFRFVPAPGAVRACFRPLSRRWGWAGSLGCPRSRILSQLLPAADFARVHRVKVVSLRDLHPAGSHRCPLVGPTTRDTASALRPPL